ncbi:MAG: hypothetical protein ACRD1Y_03715 [Terriglobales bacterium]
MRSEPHPSPELLAAFIEGGLTRRRRSELVHHCGECAECRQLAAAAGLLLHESARVGSIGSRRHGFGLAPWAIAASAILALGIFGWAGRLHAPAPVVPVRRLTTSQTALRPLPPPPSSFARPAAPPLDWVRLDTPAPLLMLPPLAPPAAGHGNLDFSSLRAGFRDQVASNDTRRQLINWGGVTAPQPVLAQPASLTAEAPQQAAAVVPGPLAGEPLAAGFAGTAVTQPASAAAAAPALAAGIGWAISRSGGLLRALAVGTWKQVPFVPGVHVRAVSARAERVWAGGNANELYTSTDHGRHWVRVTLPGLAAHAVPLRSIVFSDAGHGVITARDGQTWTTGDGGKTWTLRR